ncbi:hypothetical protein Tco_0431445 [Tanacetum coccineum]
MGTSTARVILFGTIPTTIPSTTPTTDLPTIHDDIPLIPTTLTIVPTIPPIASTIQYTSLFVCTNSYDSDTPDTPPSQDPYQVTVARWRSRVASSTSPPSPHIRQILPAPPSLPRRSAILVLPGQPIPVGRPYRTQPNRVLQMFARKRVIPLPTHRLASRYLSDYSSSDQFTSDDSSRDSPSDSLLETSSDSHSNTSSYSYSRHSSSCYAISDYPCDLPSATAVEPSCKRHSSPTSLVPVVSPVHGALSPVYADLLPPRKRIREFGSVTDVEDSYEPYTDPDVDSDIQADIDACIAFANDLRARGTNVRVVVETVAEEEVESSAKGIVEVEVDQRVGPVIDDDVCESVREDVPDHVTADETVEVTHETLGDLIQRFHDHTMEIPAHRIQVIENAQREQGHRIVTTSQQCAAMSERISTLERDNMRLRGMLDVKRQRVVRLQCSMSRVQRDLMQIRRFRFYDRVRLGRLEAYARRHLGYRF